MISLMMTSSAARIGAEIHKREDKHLARIDFIKLLYKRGYKPLE